MSNLASINVRFNVNLKEFSTEMQSALREVNAFGQKMQSVGRTLSAAVTLPIAAAGVAAVKFGSDFQESTNKVEVAFGKSADSVKEFSKTTLESFGISKGSALEMASLFGDMSTSMGLPQKEAAKMSTTLVGLAGDLASFKNIGIDQAQTALKGIFSGEMESLKQLGVVMSVAALQEYAYSKGLKEKIADMTEAEKVQLRYNFVLSKTTNSQGDFERTGGGASNQMRIFQETLKEIATSLGEVILPVFTKIISKVNEWLKSFNGLSDGAKTIIVVIAGIAAAIGPLLLAVGAVASAIPAITSGFAAMGIVTTASLGSILAPIAAVAAGLALIAYVVVNNWAPIKKSLVDVANYFVDLYNNSIVFRGSVEYVILTFKNMWAVAKLVFKSLVATVVFTGKQIFNVFKVLGGLIKSVLTLDLDGFKESLKNGFVDAAQNSVDFFKKMASHSVDTAKEIKENISQALLNTLDGNKIKKIVIPKEKIDAKGVKEAVEEAVREGITPPKKEDKKVAPADLKAIGTTIDQKNTASAGTASYYDNQIAQLKQFRDEVATTAAQVNTANNAIKEVEFAKALNLDPTSLIKVVDVVGQLEKKIISTNDALIQKQQQIMEIGQLLSESVASSFGAIGQSIVDGLGLAQTGFEGFASVMLKTVLELGQMVLKQIIMNQAASMSSAIAGATASGAATGPGAIFTTPAFIATAIGGVLAAFASIPKFANGGIVGGTSYYGDKIMARVNSKEMISNTDQQKKIWGAMNAGSTQVIPFIPELKVKGSDLIVVFNRAQARKNRIG